jgi:membrane-associated phospholipid phosphatase
MFLVGRSRDGIVPVCRSTPALARPILGLMLAGWVGLAHAQPAARPDRLGDAMRWALPAAAAGLSLYNEDVEGLKQLGFSLVASELATEALKRGVHDSRPTGSGRGFVSGHTSEAFASAAYVHRRYGLAYGLPLYALATATAHSRVRTGHHFTRQVVGGAAIGVASSLMFTSALAPGTRVSLLPTPGGLAFSYMTSW